MNTRRMFHTALFLGCAAWIALAASPVRAQCLDWRTYPLVQPQDVTGGVLHVHDDGSGPALYFARYPQTPLPANFQYIQRWNGSEFENVGAGLVGVVGPMITFDDGSGPALFAGGTFTNLGSPLTYLAKWDGSSWQAVSSGLDGPVYQMYVHDDGTGPALYVTGNFTHVGGVSAGRIARWDGTTWSALGQGIQFTTGGGAITMASWDDGTGPGLYVGGRFTIAGVAGVLNVARWSQGTWSALGTGLSHTVHGLAVFDDGTGPALYAAGEFVAPFNYTARWNGSSWSSLGLGPGSARSSLAVLDTGSGPHLCAGSFGSAPAGVSSWNGTAWTQLLATSSEDCDASNYPFVSSIATFDEGTGPHLFAATTQSALGSPRISLSRWNGTAWEPVGPTQKGINGRLYALHVHDDGSGQALYAGGGFCGADAETAYGIARFDGDAWHAVGQGLPYQVNYITAMASFSPSGNPLLYAAGSPARLFRFDGTSWSYLAATTNQMNAFLALQPFGSYLYIGGSFTTINGVDSPNIARWNGTSAQPVGSGLDGDVNALTTYDDGSGPALYAGGTFTSSGLNRIGRWNGTSWAPLGSGMNSLVDALVTFDDGTGSALYAAGTFTSAGGTAAACVARWNGTNWSALGAGLNAQVLALGVFDDGSGPALYAGGNFSASGTSSVSRLARWNGTTWTQVGAGIDGGVWALQSLDDGSGIAPRLCVGGEFQHVGGVQSRAFAEWRGCGGTIAKFCFGDGSVAPCPCSNQGLPGRGCNNSLGTGGARFNAVGRTSPDTIQLAAAGELPNAPTLVFQGDALLTSAVPFGDGLRCCGGNLRRLYTTTAVNGTIAVPGPGQPSLSARSAALGDPLSPGDVRCYQAWYRDPNPTFCASPTGNVWSTSNAVRIAW